MMKLLRWFVSLFKKNPPNHIARGSPQVIIHDDRGQVIFDSWAIPKIPDHRR